MALTALLVQGTAPANEVVDETGLKVSHVETEAKRTKIAKKDGGTRQTNYLRFEDPMLSGSIKGEPIRANGALQGLALVHPGTAQVLANIPAAANLFGFTIPNANSVIIGDPKVSHSDTKEDEFTIPFEFWPAITTFSAATS